MPKKGDKYDPNKVRDRRLKVIGYLAEGRSREFMVQELKVSAMQITKDIRAIKTSSKAFINEAIKENTPYILSLSLHNIHQVIQKANEIFVDCGEDNRLKLLTLKTVIEATRLQNDTILGGYNHLSITEANKMLELANGLGDNRSSEQDNMKQIKSYMPSLPSSPNPNQNKPIIAKNESEFESSALNKHVQTNYYYKKEKQEDAKKIK